MTTEKSDIIFWAVYKRDDQGIYKCERKISTDKRAPRARGKSPWSSMVIMDGGSKIYCDSEHMLEEARTFFRECQMTCYPRKSHDPEDLLETWV